MSAFRQIYEDAPEFISIPKFIQHQRVEVVILPLDEVSPNILPVKKRVPPPQFAGRVKELGDVMNTLSAEDWGLTE